MKRNNEKNPEMRRSLTYQDRRQWSREEFAAYKINDRKNPSKEQKGRSRFKLRFQNNLKKQKQRGVKQPTEKEKTGVVPLCVTFLSFVRVLEGRLVRNGEWAIADSSKASCPLWIFIHLLLLLHLSIGIGSEFGFFFFSFLLVRIRKTREREKGKEEDILLLCWFGLNIISIFKL